MAKALRGPYRMLVALPLLLAGAGARAGEPAPAEQKVAPTAFNAEDPQPKLLWGEEDGKSYLVPAGEILLFSVLLNQFNRRYVEPQEDYRSNWDSFEENLGGRWVFDADAFDVNQFGHPYQGSIYHNFARTAGLGYWTALGYTVAGSTLWELAGETTPPSINDEITTGIGGSFLGEPLFRIGSLILESAHGEPDGWREFAASAVTSGLNRTAFGRRFDGVFRSREPAVHTRVSVGGNFESSFRSDVGSSGLTSPDPETPALPQSYEDGEMVLDFTMAYGLPGKPGYTYYRPFDYFHLEFTGHSENVFESIMTRGLLLGAKYGVGEHYRGIWGLYGSFDYIAPQIFRVSNTALNLGTTGQWWISEGAALQCEVLAGAGYGSGGVTAGSTGLRDYHYGLTPQGLLALRLIFGDLAALELSGRDYYVTDTGSDASAGSENIARGDASLTVRVWRLHGITLRYVMSERDAHYESLPDTRQRIGTLSVGYTYIGHKWFGAVDWRPRPDLRSN